MASTSTRLVVTVLSIIASVALFHYQLFAEAANQNEQEEIQLMEQLTLDELKAVRRILKAGKAFRKKRSDDNGPLEAVVSQQAQQISTLKADLEATKNELQVTKNELQATKSNFQSSLADATLKIDERGSTFVRWGRTECANNSQLVYSGVIGGSWYNYAGGSPNHLCLTLTPQIVSMSTGSNYIFGSEYDGVSGHGSQDAVCAVCRTPQSTTIMVPSTHTCPQGWTPKYTGYIATSYYSHTRGTDYICLDEHVEDRPAGHNNDDGNRLYYAVAKCGSLPCPPYVDGKTVTCVVCSK